MADFGFEERSFATPLSRGLFIFLALLLVFVWGAVVRRDAWGLIPEKFSTDLRVEIVDVGQGDAILVRTPHGRHWLIDGGTDVDAAQAAAEGRVLVQDFLERRGIRFLDGIVVTSHHNDHLGGIIPVLQKVSVGWMCDSGEDFQGGTFKDYQALLKQKRIPRRHIVAGDRLDWGQELIVEVLSPAREAASWPNVGEDERSVSLLITYGKSSILLAGDLGKRGQREAARYGKGITAKVIKLPKHGSRDSLESAFLEMVNPVYGILSVGRNNPFGYPASSTIGVLEKRGVKLFRTDLQGSIRLVVGGREPGDFIFEVDRNR
ncbi:MAG: MBL fold metallo-hydrolase [Candidatus Ozemobacteraceae bacterium]